MWPVDFAGDCRIILSLLSGRLVRWPDRRIVHVPPDVLGVFDEFCDLLTRIIGPGIDRRRVAVDRIYIVG
jgi:hypothetical protein